MSHPLRSFPSEVVDSVIKHRPSSEVVSSTIRRDLPPEMIDYIIDHLAVTRKKKTYRDALMNCCLVSKSWVPRCRKHLFREIRLDTIKRLRAWKETFPVPAQSPDHFVCTLVVGSMRIPQEYVHRIQSLTGVVKLRMLNCLDHEFESNDPLFPFPVLSLVKSLHVCCDFLRSSEFLNLIHSFPLLVDLRITQFGEMDGAARADFWSHAPPPPLTGTLWLRWQGNRGVPLLIDLPGGLRFRKIVLAADKHSEEEVELLATLVERCLGTLECIDIDFLGVGPSGTSDLSRAAGDHARWFANTLTTITSKHQDLQRASLCKILGKHLCPSRGTEECCLDNMKADVAKKVAAKLEEQWRLWENPNPSFGPGVVAQTNAASCNVIPR